MLNWLNGILGIIVIIVGVVGIPAGTWKIVLIIVGLIIAVLGFKSALGGGEGGSQM